MATNEVFSTAGTSHRTTSSSVKSITLTQNPSGIYDMSNFVLQCEQHNHT